MKIRSRWQTRIAAAAPLLTLALLCGLSALLPNRMQTDPAADQHKQRVAEAMAQVPWTIPPWHGEERKGDVPPEAQKLLRPNAMLSRQYNCADRPPVHILLVHCGDARDMTGHYPPICYPSSGWIAVPAASPDEETLQVAGQPAKVRVYEFRRLADHGREERIRIFNAFVLPDGTLTPNIDDINKQSDRLAVSVQGVAQLQIITPSAASRTEAVTAANELLAGMNNLFAVFRVQTSAEPPERASAGFDEPVAMSPADGRGAGHGS
jgi:hypothetical protein